MIDREVLIEQAWRMLKGAVDTGVIEIDNGAARVLDAGEMSQVLRWLANLNTGKRRRAIPLPEEFRHLMGEGDEPKA